MTRVVCMGELLIDFVSNESGVLVGEATGFEKKPGGAPANVAVALARLGLDAAFMGQVGDDPFGHYLAEVLEDEHVDTTALTYSTEARTMLAFVSLGAGGERSFMFYRHPSADMLMDDFNADVLDAAAAFHFGSITMITKPARSTTLAAAEAAVERGLLVSYDPNLRRALWPSDEAAREGMMRGFQYANVVKISDEELEFLGGDVQALFHEPTRLIVVTYGAGGAKVHRRGEAPVDVAGFEVESVDTTGAGDAFVAGLLRGLLQHDDVPGEDTLREIVRFANATGALTTTGCGAIPSLPTTEAVQAMLAEH